MLSGTQNISTGQSRPLAVAVRGLRKIARLPILFFDIPVCSFSKKISAEERQAITGMLEAGDILLTADRVFPVWRLVISILGSPRYSHAAIYRGENTVVEATTFHPSGDGVARTGVNDFLLGRKNVCVLRLAYPSEYKKNIMLNWLGEQLGKPYDYSFRQENDEAMYCAKLVAKAMNIAGFPVCTKRLLRHELYLPDAFIYGPDTAIVYRRTETPARKLMNYLPVALTASACLMGMVPLTGICVLLLAAGWLQHIRIL